ncbi:MAG: endonuclease/exonuclease/phosphatase family protein [Polyangiaceae bacterium]
MFRHLTLPPLALFSSLLGCSTDDASVWQVRALTFNAALAPGFEPRSNQRLPAVVDALREASKTLDVLCVQEFWIDSQFARLREATEETLPYVVHPPPLPGSGGCTSNELATLVGCVTNACSSAGADDLVGCIQSQCESEVRSLSGGCLGCLINQLDDFSHCAPSGVAPIASDPAIFGGDSDIGLLSRHPMTQPDVLPLEAYFQRGAVAYAKVEVPQLGPVHAFCTHLSSPLGVIPYAGTSESWDSEHQREVAQLLGFIREKAGPAEPVLVMGDLNTGLALDGAGAVLPNHFEALLQSGLRDPYLDSGQPQCSECNDNGLRARDNPQCSDRSLVDSSFPPCVGASQPRVYSAGSPRLERRRESAVRSLRAAPRSFVTMTGGHSRLALLPEFVRRSAVSALHSWQRSRESHTARIRRRN